MLVNYSEGYYENGELLFDFYVVDVFDSEEFDCIIQSNLPAVEIKRLLKPHGLSNTFMHNDKIRVIGILFNELVGDEQSKMYAYPMSLFRHVEPGYNLVQEINKRVNRIKPTGLMSENSKPLWFYVMKIHYLLRLFHGVREPFHHSEITRVKFEQNLPSRDCIDEYIESYKQFDSFLQSYHNGARIYGATINNSPKFFFTRRT